MNWRKERVHDGAGRPPASSLPRISSGAQPGFPRQPLKDRKDRRRGGPESLTVPGGRKPRPGGPSGGSARPTPPTDAKRPLKTSGCHLLDDTARKSITRLSHKLRAAPGRTRTGGAEGAGEGERARERQTGTPMASARCP